MSNIVKSGSRLLWAALLLVLLAGCGTGIGGSNWPGVSASEEAVYVAYGSSVVAIDPIAQEVIWQYPPESSPAPLLAAPEISDNRVYLADYGRSQGFFAPGVVASVYALNVDGATPDLLWQNDTIARDRIVAQPLAADGKLFVGTADNALVALDVDSGDEIWRQTLGHSVWGQPSYANDVVVVSSLDRSVRAYNADSGDLLWEQALSGAIAAKPVIVGDSVYVSSFDNRVHALDLDSGQELWQVEATNWIWGAPVVADDELFFADVQGNVYAVNARSGDILWQTDVDGAVEAGLALHDGMLYVSTIFGRTTDEQSGQLIALDTADGDTLWQIDLPLPVYSQPAIVGDQLIVILSSGDGNAEEFELRTFDLTEGRQRWAYSPNAE